MMSQNDVFKWVLGFGAFLLASISAYFSIFGLAYTFAAQFWAVICMGIGLEYAKLTLTSFLYRFRDIGKLFRTCCYIVILIPVILSMVGHFGFLMSGYQSASTGLKDTTAQIQLIQTEKNELMQRKAQIDQQISQLPPERVRDRIRLTNSFKKEVEVINERLPIINKQIQELSTQSLQSQSHVGPIVFIADAFELSVDDAAKIIVFLIVLAFDPLVICLTIAYNVAATRSKQNTIEHDPQSLEEISAKTERAVAVPEPASPIGENVHEPEQIVSTQLPEDAEPSFTEYLDILSAFPEKMQSVDVAKLQEFVNHVDSLKDPYPSLLKAKARCKKLLRNKVE